ncbi:DUF3011 domain-containing protein [Marinibaculum pumilum]|uniref:DUF3011 domain-containing protein n=1 Tax=Marinibaculum pumilum TaxID=1766165 RepID=A0ABV7L5Q9_9PROT
MGLRPVCRAGIAAGAAMLVAAAALALAGTAAARSGGSTVPCYSENYHYKHCPADTRGGVQLFEQYSRGRGRCVEGQSWGWDQRGVWVNDGCRALFWAGPPYGARRGWDRGRPWDDGRDRDRGRPPPGIVGQPLGGLLGAQPGGPRPPWQRPGGHGAPGRGQPSSFTLDCASQGYRRAFCYADTSGGVALEQQYSNRSGECREGHSWGASARGIWVDNGCRARFRVWPAWGRRR